jgi:dihydrofolate reductase
MGKIVAAINISIDGFCDHTAMIPDEEIHEHYSDLLSSADTILYGRITFQLMEYWLSILKNPTGKKSMDEFAVAIDKIHKIVFSKTLKNIEWETASLAEGDLAEVVSTLKKSESKNVLVGSPSLIVSLTKLKLIDEYQLCVHPVVAGKGLPLFKHIDEKINLKFIKAKTFKGGAIILYYEPNKK